jgi:regulator of sirC expression with transglutaminase-like and TPR domain
MNLDAALQQLAHEPEAALDVAQVALHLARDEYPDLDVEAYLSELDAMAHEARTYLGGGLEAKVAGLCRYLFHEMGFRGNQRDYDDPRNSYLNQVIDRRTGLPITLSAVAMAVGTRAGLEVVGVGLPGHFVAKAVEGRHEVFFDPFHGGRVLTPESCEQLVQRVTGMPFRATADQLRALPLGLMVQRLLTNLKGIYLRDGEFGRAVRVIERLRQVNPGDRLLVRDHGIGLLGAGRPGRAYDCLLTYLTTPPTPADAASVQQLLDRASAEMAKWN